MVSCPKVHNLVRTLCAHQLLVRYHFEITVDQVQIGAFLVLRSLRIAHWHLGVQLPQLVLRNFGLCSMSVQIPVQLLVNLGRKQLFIGTQMTSVQRQHRVAMGNGFLVDDHLVGERVTAQIIGREYPLLENAQ